VFWAGAWSEFVEQIIYISTAREVPSAAVVESILAVSRRNNRRDGLTGLLVVGGRRFLQVLEGPRGFTEAAYERIRADNRHYALVQLSRKLITRRAFEGWDMGCEQIHGGDLGDHVHQLTERLDDADLRAQFRSFVDLHRTAA
jgi:hypothetical protein